MKHERSVPILESDSVRHGDLVCELDRIQFNERIAHLQRRTRLQRRIIERLASHGDIARLDELQAIILALDEIEERNLVLEDVIKTVRAELARNEGSLGVMTLLSEDDARKNGVVGSPASLVHEGRLEAEKLRAQGNFKRARRVLRGVRCRKALAGGGLQMLAVSRYRVIRALFSFYRYRGTQ